MATKTSPGCILRESIRTATAGFEETKLSNSFKFILWHPNRGTGQVDPTLAGLSFYVAMPGGATGQRHAFRLWQYRHLGDFG